MKLFNLHTFHTFLFALVSFTIVANSIVITLTDYGCGTFPIVKAENPLYFIYNILLLVRIILNSSLLLAFLGAVGIGVYQLIKFYRSGKQDGNSLNSAISLFYTSFFIGVLLYGYLLSLLSPRIDICLYNEIDFIQTAIGALLISLITIVASVALYSLLYYFLKRKLAVVVFIILISTVTWLITNLATAFVVLAITSGISVYIGRKLHTSGLVTQTSTAAHLKRVMKWAGITLGAIWLIIGLFAITYVINADWFEKERKYSSGTFFRQETSQEF